MFVHRYLPPNASSAATLPHLLSIFMFFFIIINNLHPPVNVPTCLEGHPQGQEQPTGAISPQQPSAAGCSFFRNGALLLHPPSLLELWLAWSCAGNHSVCELICATVMPCPDVSLSQLPSISWLLCILCDVPWALHGGGRYKWPMHTWELRYLHSALRSVISLSINQYL